MTDGDALQRAVITTPDDDTPRLIYADWLDENGQSDRATFIRAQIEAVRAEPFGLQARTAEAKASRLLETHRKTWTRHLHGNLIEPPRFQRGFIEHVAVEPIAFSDAITAIFDAEPVQSLRIIRPDDVMEWISLLPIFELPQLQQIRQLEFTSRRAFLHDEYVGLTQSAYLTKVQKLSLRGVPIHPPWLSEMLGSEAFPELTGLDIANIAHLGPSLLNAVTRATHRKLKSLDASDVRFTSDQLQQILASRCLQSVEELRLGYSGRVGETGPLFHLDVGWVIPWERLVILDLAGQRLGDDAVRASALDDARALRWLGLSNNGLGYETVRHLLKSKHLSLNYLDVRGNGFTLAAIAALQERFPNALIVK